MSKHPKYVKGDKSDPRNATNPTIYPFQELGVLRLRGRVTVDFRSPTEEAAWLRMILYVDKEIYPRMDTTATLDILSE